ncbi:hypothetical protein A2634_03105 [Candidatus Amesbacteria bacterium RIFCSPHIGHO2_01_FULL_48_32]|uniref:Uncharacterized protein n=1 Tax=Candidatus Amesbacteria bacterium RIFCSPLOWO2_01_FULL_48_25 TaxID=1797259 RepID=A0A1F4ZBG5_9BACT|nr:MAG: hypothetical protein A2634_03105 [Candidatus Amesbacteria bacterium RIFCSPHIGHO2_01_FULL_48_32]OGD03603.1 MAG: hypothetical protein A2989_02885 [Candidatus Amesbacteria bacterium RIFCSPLOWO2_01_FULL_48_25]HJZ04433.1 hypothetical protein [Patescibacteria group bacterium]
MKNNGPVYLILALLVIAASVWFYWFQWRTSKIRKECYQKSFAIDEYRNESNRSGDDKWAWGKDWMPNPLQDRWDAKWGWWHRLTSQKTVEGWYNQCLLKNGMKI